MGQHLLPLEQLGGPARALRAFRRLLFVESADLEGSPVLKELPRPEVLHHLYSRAPAELQSPHTRSSLTPAQVTQNIVCLAGFHRLPAPVFWPAHSSCQHMHTFF